MAFVDNEGFEVTLSNINFCVYLKSRKLIELKVFFLNQIALILYKVFQNSHLKEALAGAAAQ